jgi:hypothetical protein
MAFFNEWCNLYIVKIALAQTLFKGAAPYF